MTSLSANNAGALLTLTDVTLEYGHFRALSHVKFTLGHGKVHAVVGEHGAGKSSLGQLISGVLKPQTGHIIFDGRAYRGMTINMARKLGIELVHQQILSLNEKFTVAENLFLTTAPFFRKLAWRYETLRQASAFLQQHHVDIDPLALVAELNPSDQILIDILKHIYVQPRLLILDEALEKLSTDSFNKVVNILINLKQQGTSILLITHKIDDIYELADNVSILKNGEILLTDDVHNIDKINLIKMAYIQLSDDPHITDLNKEFYQLLKYNEAILRNLPVNLIVTDNENRIKMVNDYCKRVFGLKQASYFNVPLVQLLSSANDEVRALSQEGPLDNEEHTFYQAPITLNNNPIICNLKTFPIYDGAFLIGNIIIIEDVTEYDHLQKQVILSEKLASVGLLAAGVAHEINNPLGIIYNYLSYIKSRFHDMELHEAVDNVHEEIAAISTIVSNLHTFSDSTQISLEDLDVNALIRGMLNLIKHSAKHKEVAIHFEPSEEEIEILANKNELKQVILNLLKNSFEAMPSGGDLYIHTGLLSENGTNLVQMTFQDTGPGISDENPQNIFLPFYSTKKGSEQNLGLGLSVSYGIIKKYHGTITVENVEGAGCQFVITLPQSA
jgi:PAS domain S-box-containing protein